MEQLYKINEKISTNEIVARIDSLALEINKQIEDKDIIVIGLLDGSFMFVSDIVRKLKAKSIHLEFIKAKSYSGVTSTGVVTFDRELKIDFNGKYILLLDDIIDTGRTLNVIQDYLIERGAKEVLVAAMLDKKSKRLPEIDIPSYFCGFEIEDYFAVGYGLDYNGKFRELPFIGELKFL